MWRVLREPKGYVSQAIKLRSHEQSFCATFRTPCWIITVNLYSRTDTDEKWTNNNNRFVIKVARHALFGKENLPVYFNLYTHYIYCKIDAECRFYAPNFEEVEGDAYWFGPLRACVRASARACIRYASHTV